MWPVRRFWIELEDGALPSFFSPIGIRIRVMVGTLVLVGLAFSSRLGGRVSAADSFAAD